MKTKFKIKGIDCANCAAKLEISIQKMEGIKSASLSFMAERLEIEYDCEKEEIIKRLKKLIKKEEPDATLEEI